MHAECHKQRFTWLLVTMIIQRRRAIHSEMAEEASIPFVSVEVSVSQWENTFTNESLSFNFFLLKGPPTSLQTCFVGVKHTAHQSKALNQPTSCLFFCRAVINSTPEYRIQSSEEKTMNTYFGHIFWPWAKYCQSAASVQNNLYQTAV